MSRLLWEMDAMGSLAYRPVAAANGSTLEGEAPAEPRNGPRQVRHSTPALRGLRTAANGSALALLMAGSLLLLRAPAVHGGETMNQAQNAPTGPVAVPAAAVPRPLIGAIRWDAWHRPRTAGEPGGAGGPVLAMIRSLAPQRYHGRLPFFASVVSDTEVNIGGYTQEILDREIGFAKAGGIDYWAFLLYEEGTAMSDGLALYLSSQRQMDVSFCAITSPNTFGNAQQFRQRLQRVVRLIAEPSYQKVLAGRPLLYLFDVSDEWVKAWGGDANARLLFDELRNAVRAAGQADPYLVVMDFSADHGKRIADIVGAQALSSYAAPGAVGAGAPYQDLTRAATAFWEQCYDTGADVVPLAMAGWDRRPRVEQPVPWEKWQQPGVGIEKYYVLPTPAELAEHLRETMDWVTANRSRCPAQALIVYAWNEHDEGGFLCPTLNPDGSANAGRLEAIAAMTQHFVPTPVTVTELPRAGLSLWLDAAAPDSVVREQGKVVLWRDISGSGHDARAVNSTMTYVAYPEGRNVVRCGGSPGHFVVPTLKAAGELTVFTVARRVPGLPSATYGRILSFHDGATRQNDRPADWVAPSWCVPVMNEQPFAARLSVSRPGQVDGLCVGMNMGTQGDFLLGDLCEIIVYKRPLNPAEVQAVRTRLRTKWATGSAWDGPPAGGPTE